MNILGRILIVEDDPNIVDLIVPFKRPVYEQVVRKFKKFARDAS